MAAVEIKTRRRLGEILIDLGLLDEAGLDRALEQQRSSGRRLGDVLTSEGRLRHIDLLQALAVQYDLQFVDLDEITIDYEIAQRVPAQMALRHRALPLFKEDGMVVVAMANPADVLALDDIRSVVGGQVRPAMADISQIRRAVDELQHSDTRVHEAIQAAVGENGPQVVPDTVVATEEPSESSPVVRFVDLVLARALQEGASDIHLEPSAEGFAIRFRVDGVLREAMSPPKALQAGVVSRVKVMASMDIAERRAPQDGRMTVSVGTEDLDFRVVTVPTVHGEAVVLRALPSGIHRNGLPELGFLPEQLTKFRQAYQRPWGAVLVTGPTGSGKSTTLYGALEEIRDPTRNIITIEDPVEYRMDGLKQVQVNEKAGVTFATSLRSFLRADPDVILVGEIRDGETAATAIEASLTGHLVLSTLHTNNSASTPMRLIEMGVQPFLVTSSLNAIVAQRLARRLCERCKVVKRIDESSPHAEALVGGEVDFIEIFEPQGCAACNDSGYRGRLAVHEVMPMTTTLGKLILEGASVGDIENTAVDEGMLTLRSDGLRKVLDGITSLEEIYRITS